MTITLKKAKVVKAQVTEPKKAKKKTEVDLTRLQAIGLVALRQKGLGLGYPKTQKQFEVEAPDTSLTNVDKLAEEFGCVEIPKATNDFCILGAHASRTVSVLPKLVMTELTEDLQVVTVYKSPTAGWGNAEYRAKIPAMPPSVLDLAEKAKGICPQGIFHLIFEASWQKQPQGDPVLLMQIGKNYFEIAAWGGDQDLISEYVLAKKAEKKN